jgi:hypothetical protein
MCITIWETVQLHQYKVTVKKINALMGYGS